MKEPDMITLDVETQKILAEALMKIGLAKGYCYTGNWYNLEVKFLIPSCTHVRIDEIIFKKVDNHGQTKLL